jgi:phospholipid/cholesterol/gamma-HCH transport system permease protein
VSPALVGTAILNVDSFAYWKYTRDAVENLDIFAGVFRSYFFGTAIAPLGCQRGLSARAGTQGVGRAATEAFVFSLIAILVLDFVIRVCRNNIDKALDPEARGIW